MAIHDPTAKQIRVDFLSDHCRDEREVLAPCGFVNAHRRRPHHFLDVTIQSHMNVAVFRKQISRKLLQLGRVAAAPREARRIEVAVQVARHMLACRVIAYPFDSAVVEPVWLVAGLELTGDEFRTAIELRDSEVVYRVADQILHIRTAAYLRAFHPAPVTRFAQHTQPRLGTVGSG